MPEYPTFESVYKEIDSKLEQVLEMVAPENGLSQEKRVVALVHVLNQCTELINEYFYETVMSCQSAD